MKYVRAVREAAKKLNFILTTKQKKQGLLVMILLIVGSFLETLGVSAILPFIESILSPEKVMEKWYAIILMRIFPINSLQTMIVAIGICIIAVYLIKNVYLYSVTMFHTIYRSKIQRDLSTLLLKSYMNRDYEFYTQINTAEIQRGIGADVAGLYNYMDSLFRFFGEAFTAFLIAAFLVKTDALMAIGVVIIAGLGFGVIVLGLRKRTKLYGELNRITDKERFNCAMQAIGGFKEIKVTQTTEHFVEAYNVAYENQRQASVKNEYLINLPERIIETVCVAALLGIVCIKVLLGMDMTSFAPKLSVFAVAAFRLLPSVSRMTRYMNGMIFNQVFLQGVYENMQEMCQYEKEKDGIPSAEYQKTMQDLEGVTKETLSEKTFEEEILIKQISWHYKTGDDVLRDLSLRIGKGEAVGLVGASGAGKSTLADVLLGLLRPQKGQVLLDGEDIFLHLVSWSKLVGYVPQNIFLLDDTIRANVAFGCKQEDMDEGKVWNALKEAQLDEYVRTLPEQLDTQVGERGIKFSGGQRQRIAIARAFYNNPSILILDEATSALDNETEEAVMAAIDALHGQKTLIIVAHRLTTLKKCDAIYEIGDGKATLRDYRDLLKN